MPKSFKIKSIKNEDYSNKNFIGFETTYPIQLYGLISVKEYTQSINFLNENTRREYDSSVLKYIIFYIICGLLPGLVAYFVELNKSTRYKNKFEKDLQYSIEQINKSFFDKRIVVSYRMEKKLFVRKMRVVLKFKIPDDSTIEIPTTNKTISPENKEIIVLATNNSYNNSNSDRVQYQRSHTYKLDPTDSSFTFIKIQYIKKKDQDFVDFKGFELGDYKYELFNYMSEIEFTNMITDINQTVSKIRMNRFGKGFYKFAVVLSFFVFGLFILFPALVFYHNYKIKYFNKLYTALNNKVQEYTTQFGSRGLSISYQVYSRGMSLQTSLIDLIIYLPRDISNSPTLVKLSNGSLAIEPCVENGIAPIFMNQNLFIKNYEIISSTPAPLLPYIDTN